MKKFLLLILIASFLFACGEKNTYLSGESGVIGIEYIVNGKTTIGESTSVPTKVGILVSSVILSQDIVNEQVELVINCTITNYSGIPLYIRVGTKYLIDTKERIYGPIDGSSKILNPGLKGQFQYTYQIPQSIIIDPLFFSYLDYIDDANKKKGIAPKWKVKIKDLSDAFPDDGEKNTLIW